MSASECEGLRRRVCELEALLCEEQARNARLSREAQGLREEEHLTSALRRKLQDVQREKERIVLQVEQEEEHLTNTLLKKLHDVRCGWEWGCGCCLNMLYHAFVVIIIIIIVVVVVVVVTCCIMLLLSSW